MEQNEQGATNERPAYQTRVLEEKRELDEKISKLDAFLSKDETELVGVGAELMRRQSAAMKVYSGILEERLVSFGIMVAGSSIALEGEGLPG
jgi:hypothetical protein